MIDPCFYWVLNKGSCSNSTVCNGHRKRPHEWPNGATQADKDGLLAWLRGPDSAVK